MGILRGKPARPPVVSAEDRMETAARVLALAQQTADQAIADAGREAERIIAEARKEADAIRAQARGDFAVEPLPGQEGDF
jgi:F0F1-type ATP synthase membrane subunit b/b'